MIGTIRLVANITSRAFKIYFLINEKTMKATIPLNIGEITQEDAILATFPQSIESTHPAITPKPTTAPTIECVVLTGQPNDVAICSQKPCG